MEISGIIKHRSDQRLSVYCFLTLSCKRLTAPIPANAAREGENLNAYFLIYKLAFLLSYSTGTRKRDFTAFVVKEMGKKCHFVIFICTVRLTLPH